MKLKLISLVWLAALMLTPAGVKAQSLKDLLNLDNVTKVVEAVTGKTATVELVGTWTYQGSAVEFESSNLLMQAGGAVAASTVKTKMNEQLKKLGIKAGQMTFTFNADSTFVSKVGSRTAEGTYSYDATAKQLTISYLQLVNLSAKVNCTGTTLELLFNSDKVLKIVAFLAGKTTNTTLQTISALAEKYDGMMLGFTMTKK